MAQWPPSPVVEDEATALAKECGVDAVKQVSPTEDHPVPSRGSIDQCPIICDSQTQKDTTLPALHTDMPCEKQKKATRQAEQPRDPAIPKKDRVSDTPSSSDTESRGRATHTGKNADRGTASSAPRSQSASRVAEITESRSRPSISRIQTDVAGEIQNMKSGTRRAPSPYSYNRESGTVPSQPPTRSATEQFLSPAHAVESPVSIQRPRSRQDAYREPRDHDSSTDSEKKPKKTLRFADKPMGPAPPSQPRKSFSLPESRSREQELEGLQAPRSETEQSPKHRKIHHHHHPHHHEYPDDSNTDVESNLHVPKSRSSRSSSKARESPYSSASEEPVKHGRSRDTKEAVADEQVVHRRLSHRYERPRLEEPLGHIFTHHRTDSVNDDSSRRVYRIRDPRTPMTPPSVTTPNHMEDYFSNAFRDNALKHSKYTSHSSTDDTAVFSPPSSPPRTPRSERRGHVDFFESPSSSPVRTPTGSRPPSLEESQIRDLKAHHSLLSQATAGAAAVAARISPPATRSSSTIDTALDNPNHVVITKARSRASSPVRKPASQGSRIEPLGNSQPRSRASSPQREALKPIIHRADSLSHNRSRSRAPSPHREMAKSAVRADSLNYGQPRSRPSSPQREPLRPVVHRADTFSYGQPRPRPISPEMEPLKPAVRNDSLTYEKPRSRAPSPQREVPKPAIRADSLTNVQSNVTRTYYVPAPQTKRPSTRDGLPKVDSMPQPPPTTPQRTASFTGVEHQRPYVAHLPGPLHAMTAMSNMPPSTSLKVPPPLLRSHSASTPAEIVQKLDDFALPPCPRSQPTQGLRDWLTIKGIPNIDICPKCAHTLSTTRYRTSLIRSPDKPYNRNTVCAMSRPWVRIAVIQCVKRNRMDLSLVRDANTLALGARPCEGSRPDVRIWWRLHDSSTENAVANFLACSACIGSVHAVYPELEHAFTRDALNQEGICSLRCTSREFYVYAEQLEKIAEKCRDRGQCKSRYMQPLVEAVKQFSMPLHYVECARDRMLTSRPWHFMDALPEFTICEACFEDVVWPVKDKPYARDISRTTKIVPASAYKGSDPAAAASGGLHPTSCQLYSDRMRRYFSDVVNGRVSWDVFKTKVRERQAAQYRLIEMNRMYAEDQRMGWDRRGEIDRNWAYWRSLE